MKETKTQIQLPNGEVIDTEAVVFGCIQHSMVILDTHKKQHQLHFNSQEHALEWLYDFMPKCDPANAVQGRREFNRSFIQSYISKNKSESYL